MRKVLIIEDHVDLRRLIRLTPEFEDHEIHEAASGTEGLAEARRLLHDVALLEVMLPCGQDGTSVVMLSALGASAGRARGFRAGAEAYLAEPFSLLNLMGRRLASREQA